VLVKISAAPLPAATATPIGKSASAFKPEPFMLDDELTLELLTATLEGALELAGTLDGATLEGTLELEGATLDGALELEGATLEGTLELEGAALELPPTTP